MLSGLFGSGSLPLLVVVKAKVIAARTIRTTAITKTSAFRLSISPTSTASRPFDPVSIIPAGWESGGLWVERPMAQTAARAWSRSAMMSSGDSIPTENRIIPSVTPILRLVSGSTFE